MPATAGMPPTAMRQVTERETKPVRARMPAIAGANTAGRPVCQAQYGHHAAAKASATAGSASTARMPAVRTPSYSAGTPEALEFPSFFLGIAISEK